MTGLDDVLIFGFDWVNLLEKKEPAISGSLFFFFYYLLKLTELEKCVYCNSDKQLLTCSPSEGLHMRAPSGDALKTASGSFSEQWTTGLELFLELTGTMQKVTLVRPHLCHV